MITPSPSRRRSPPASPPCPSSPSSVPAHAQWIVFDPTNFSQNVLTAARELQQVNNEIQSLENQATMLINQARNLASLPYSSLAQLEQRRSSTPSSFSTQAQRIAYSVTTIDQAFTQTYPQSLFGLDLHRSSSSPTRRRAGRTRAPPSRTPCTSRPAWCRTSTTTRTQIDALVSSSQSATGALQAAQSGNQLVGLQTTAARRPHRRHGRDRARPEPRRRAHARRPRRRRKQQITNFLNYGAGYQPGSAQMFH